ncbi:MAG: hypothetical protein AAB682_00270, partial [Patescibacteria group bacterium]
MKKNIFIGFLAVLLVPTFAFAATFNGASGDLTTVTVSNVTRNPNSTGSWATSVNANAGETVAVQIYYRNTSTTETTPNTKVSFTIPSGTASSQSVSGSVRADNASQVGGTATINLSSSQTLTFVPGSFYWLPDQDTSVSNPITVPPGTQTEGNLFSGGLELGTIPAAPVSRPFQYQGNVIIHLLVGNSGSGNTNVGNPTVTTNSASVSTFDSATLNGYISLNGNSNVNGFFDYSTNNSLSGFIRTSSQNFSGSSASYSQNINGLSPNTTYFYRAVAQGQNGQQVFGNTLSFVTGNGNNNSGISIPIVTTNPANLISGNNNAILNGFLTSTGSIGIATTYFEYGANQLLGSRTPSTSLTGGPFSYPLQNLSPNTTYFFRAVAQNNYGTSQGSILSFATGNGSSVNYVGNFNVVSGGASETFSDSSRVAGSYSAPNNTITSYWFEYGTTQNLGSQTLSLVPSVSGNAGSFSGVLLNLLPSTRYYYRAAGQSNGGEISRGSILSFVTGVAPVYFSQVVNAPIATPVVTSSVVRALTSLSYGIDRDRVSAGETLVYKIGWRNENTIPLRDAFLRVTLPEKVSFAGGDVGVNSADNRTLFYNIGIIGAGKSGSINFRGALDRDLNSGTVLPLRADLNFTDPITSRPATISLDGKVLVENTNGTNITSSTVVVDGT